MASPASINERPHQASSKFTFPTKNFWKKQDIIRSFQISLFEKWAWLHCVEAEDAAFCFVSVSRTIKLVWLDLEQPFIKKDSRIERMGRNHMNGKHTCHD